MTYLEKTRPKLGTFFQLTRSLISTYIYIYIYAQMLVGLKISIWFRHNHHQLTVILDYRRGFQPGRVSINFFWLFRGHVGHVPQALTPSPSTQLLKGHKKRFFSLFFVWIFTNFSWFGLLQFILFFIYSIIIGTKYFLLWVENISFSYCWLFTFFLKVFLKLLYKKISFPNQLRYRG